MNRLMIAGTHSGSGKTTVTCAILQALVNRSLDVASFKCGPDYIDPLFHSQIIGADAHNLDRFFCTSDTIRMLLHKYSREYNVIEGVMGFYDGVKGTASSYQLAVETDTPVILVIDCKGMGDSIGAVMQGFLRYREPNPIIGCVFNRLPESLAALAQSLCRDMKITYFGRFPAAPECTVESRHLGLVTAEEIADIKEKTSRLAALAEKHLFLDRLLALTKCDALPAVNVPPFGRINAQGIRIAVARDRAFCFLYRENLDLLCEMGCEIVFFSPLDDTTLPDHIGGLILCGGYPELYAEQLSRNKALWEEIREKMAHGMPTIAECGGFMALHEQMQGEDGVFYPMAGAIRGKAFRTEKLRRFGYIHLTADRDNLLCGSGESIAAHEFHYWDSTSPGGDFTACKASSGMDYPCAHATDTLYAGFPHLYFYAKPSIAWNFSKKCMDYQTRNEPS